MDVRLSEVIAALSQALDAWLPDRERDAEQPRFTKDAASVPQAPTGR